MARPQWVEPDIGEMKAHVFASDRYPARGKTPDTGREFCVYEFNPRIKNPSCEQGELLGVYRLNDLIWF